MKFFPVDKVKCGMLWTGLEKILVYGVGFVQSVVLARLLCPEDFGLAAMLGIFLGLGGILAESGLGSALVVLAPRLVNPREIMNLERKALRWNVGIAVVAYVALAVAAPGIAAWYGKPVLAPLMWVMAVGMVVSAVSVVATSRLSRKLEFGRLAFINSVSSILGAVVAIGLAYAGAGVWAIAAMSLSSAAVRTVFAWCLAGRVRGSVPDDKPSVRATSVAFSYLLSYGTKLMASGMVHSVYAESYNLIIGKVWSPASVGLFARGNRWARLPAEVVNDSVGRVALPKLARGNRPGKFLIANIVLLWPALVVLLVYAQEIVGLVLGTKWLDCVPYLRILIVGQFFTPIGNVALQEIRASGRAEIVLKTDMWKKPIGLAALVCGIPFGIVGLCWSKVASDLAEAVTDLWYALRYRQETPVDLVYCWYAGKIPDGADKCRFADNGELYYSILSVDRFAPWFRRIYVFVNDDSPVPDWLWSHPKVRIVRLSEVIPTGVLPLNNSASIEMWIHLLPDLSERFVYANDDMFLGRPVRPCDFFDRRGRMICRYSGYGNVFSAANNAYDGMLQFSRRFLKDSYRRYPHHNMDGYLKSVIADFWKTYPEESLRSGSFRHRVSDQLHRDVFSCYAVKTGRGVRRISDRLLRLHRYFGLRLYASLSFDLSDESALDMLKEFRPKFFCLNDTESCTDVHREKVRHILSELLIR